MTLDNIATLVQVMLALASFAALVPVLYKMRAERQKEEAVAKESEASAASKLSDAAMAMLAKWEAREVALTQKVEKLEAKVEKLERHLEFWQEGATISLQQLLDNNIEPKWDPSKGPDGAEGA